MHEWFAPRQQEMPLQLAGALHFFPACIQIWQKAVVPSPSLHLRAFCWEGLEGRDSDQRAACLPVQIVRVVWAPPVKTTSSHSGVTSQGLTFVHRPLSIVGTSPMGTIWALRYTMNTLTSVLHQLPPSGIGDTTQAIVVPSASPQQQLGENHTSSLTSTKWPQKGAKQPVNTA